MDLLVTAALAALLLAFAGLSIETIRRVSRPPRQQPSWLARAERRRIVVHTIDDKSIEGLLAEADDEVLVLSQARYLDETDVELAGDVLVPRGKVRFWQVIP